MIDKIRTLVVEDKTELAQLIAKYIGEHPLYEVIGIAETLADARLMQNTLKPDLIILDIYLPDGTGLDWLRKLRTSKTMDVDVILLSAANDSQSVISGIRLGAFDYLIKPLALTMLGDVLNRFRDYHRTIKNKEGFNQADINRVYGVRRDIETIDELPKNIDQFTLNEIINAFDENNVVHTTASICKLCGVSKTTARRYLEYAVKMGFLEASLTHGNIGRPTRKYIKVSEKKQ